MLYALRGGFALNCCIYLLLFARVFCLFCLDCWLELYCVLAPRTFAGCCLLALIFAWYGYCECCFVWCCPHGHGFAGFWFYFVVVGVICVLCFMCGLFCGLVVVSALLPLVKCVCAWLAFFGVGLGGRLCITLDSSNYEFAVLVEFVLDLYLLFGLLALSFGWCVWIGCVCFNFRVCLRLLLYCLIECERWVGCIIVLLLDVPFACVVDCCCVLVVSGVVCYVS